MSLIKDVFMKFLRFLSSFIFVIMLSIFALSWIINDFTKESNIKPLFTSFYSEYIDKNLDPYTQEQIKNSIKEECSSNNIFTLPLISVNISCEKYNENLDIKEFLTEEIVNYFYERDYKIEDCIAKDFTCVFTREFNNLSQKITLYSLIASLFFGLIYILIEDGDISKRTRGISILIAIVALPAIILMILFDPIKQKYIDIALSEPFIENFVKISIEKYSILLFISAIILLLSFLVKFFKKD